MSELEFEPVRGLPENLPPGEHILWQGEPIARSLARRAFHVRGLSTYFAVLVILRGVVAAASGASAADAAMASLEVLPLALFAISLVVGLAHLEARAAVFTITNHRVVMRFGAAIPMTINLPFSRILSAGIKVHDGGAGDLVLRLTKDGKLAFLHLWPFARPWRLARPEPLLRSIPDVAAVGEILAEALVAAGHGVRPVLEPEPRAPVPTRTLATTD